MKNKSLYYNFLTLLVMAAFIIFTYVMMRSLGLEEESGSVGGIIYFFMSAVTILTMFTSGFRFQGHFVILWFFWIIWMFLYFFLGLGGGGSAGIFRVWFCPMSFLFFYMVSSKTDSVEKISIVGFIVLYVLAYYLTFYELFNFQSVQFGKDVGRTNLVFWCLCSLPFILLIEKNWAQVVTLLLTVFIVILTAKRSAIIAIGLILLLYVSSKMRGRNKTRNIIFIIIAGVGLYFVVTHYIMDTFLGVMERMSEMQEDKGSGRLIGYNDAFSVMENNTLIEWFIGRGFGTITLSGHTNAHNDALQLLFEYGFIGLVYYILLIFYSWKRVRLLHKLKSPYYFAYITSFIIFIVLGMVSNLVVFFLYFAFICAFWGVVEARIQNNPYVRLSKLSI